MEEKPLFDSNSTDQLTKERGICLQYDCAVKKLYEVFAQCEKRVKSKEYTAETCEEEIIDLMEELDQCVDDKAFKNFI
ncbi:PREDICTED: uncharacterized protein LOC106106125 [Papilio polytes]|uniref:uncharacterized protein LOC106106125 n=1 Tax=Papilio polytes TaxID=76194 RepID=UPI0006761E1A|nr:PREDICTED: uncharacterized protein LOC106106125 [Papilio polytes]